MKDREEKIATNVINKLFKHYAKEWWFKAIIGVLLTGIAIIVLFFGLRWAINNTMDERETSKRNEHQTDFMASMQTYSTIKKLMYSYNEKIGSDYLLVCEFHNGNENIMTGVQFCKFDLTIEVLSQNSTWIPFEKFHDDLLCRYDIILSDEFANGDLIVCDYADLNKPNGDLYLYYQLQYVGAKKIALQALKDNNDKIFGVLVVLSKEEKPLNDIQIIKCASHLEREFVSSNLSQHKKNKKI